MKILGITAEYNPFHNGHAYHIAQARESIKPDCVAVCMSGSFTQRGSMAILDKWTRAALALDHADDSSKQSAYAGADLVVELPFVFACNRAPVFARGGVDTLVSLGATHISFGCEAEDPQELIQMAELLRLSAEAISQQTAEAMKEGISHAKAYERAVASVAGDGAAKLLQTPNNILAVEYLQRILHWREKGVNLEPVPVRRMGSGYTEMNPSAGVAGASAIRRLIMEQPGKLTLASDREKETGIASFVPQIVYNQLPDGERLLSAERKYFELVRAELVRRSPEELARIYSIGEGIENRFRKAASRNDSLDALIEDVTSRRYTSAAVHRMLTYILLGLDGERADACIADNGNACRYLRLLAVNERGRRCIRACKEKEIPFLTNVNKEAETLNGPAADMLALDMLAADMWNILFGRDMYGNSDKVVRPAIEKAFP